MKMYKQYNKCKTAKEVLTKCIAEWERERLYLDSVHDFLSVKCFQCSVLLNDFHGE